MVDNLKLTLRKVIKNNIETMFSCNLVYIQTSVITNIGLKRIKIVAKRESKDTLEVKISIEKTIPVSKTMSILEIRDNIKSLNSFIDEFKQVNRIPYKERKSDRSN